MQRSTSDRPWLARYAHYQERNDLLPFWFASDWVDIPTEEGLGGSVTIAIGDDFWLYDLSFLAQGNTLEDQKVLPTVVVPGIEIRMRLDGNLAWGSWIDNSMQFIARSEVSNDFGEGWILERGSFVTIEWRRLYTLPDTEMTEQRGQWILHGCKLAPKDSSRLKAGWRNQTMQDWCREAVLSPYKYATRVCSADIDEALASVQMNLRTRDRDFILERIGWGQYITEAGTTATGDIYAGGYPFAATLTVQDVPWHNSAPQGVACNAFSKMHMAGPLPDSSRELRIPRVIAANSLLEMRVGFPQFAIDDDYLPYFGDIFVYIAGHEIIGDNRAGNAR